MAMPDGVYMIGLGVSLFGLGFTVQAAFDGWIKMKRLERETRESEQAPPTPVSADVADRLARIEQIVELTSIEVERVAEAHRFVARQLAESRPAAIQPGRTPERVITPH